MIRINSVDEQELNSLVEDPNLAELEEIISKFNMFEALGIVDAELKHSRFLGWLLNPSQTHSIGDEFLKIFLKWMSKIANAQKIAAPSVVEFDSWDLTETDIRREWHNIDILIRNSTYKFSCVVENKVWTKEHDNQLAKYRETVERSFPGKSMFVFLTPAGEKPSDPNYISLSYSEIRDMIIVLLQREKDISDDVATLLNHYKMTIERDITQGDRIKELSRMIYRTHRKALETIMQEADSLQNAILTMVAALIPENNELLLEQSSPSIVRFIAKKFDDLVPKSGSGQWMKSRRMLVFEFKALPNRSAIHLYIGPGDGNIRNRIFEAAKKVGKGTFNVMAPSLYREYNEIYRKVIFDEKSMHDLEPESDELEALLRREFDSFVKVDLQKIIGAIPSLFEGH